MTLKSKPLAIIILIILFGGITLANNLAWWRTESTKQVAKFTNGEFAGQPDPADIRGSYSFGDIELNFNVPATTLARAFGITGNVNTAAFQVKNLEALYTDQELEIGTSSVRLFVALYTGLPYETFEDIYLPSRATEMLKLHGKLTAEQIAYLESHTIVMNDLPAPKISSEEHAQTGDAAQLIKGKTTFQEVIDLGVSQAIIEDILGHKMPNPLIRVKDFCIEKGLNFEDVKLAIQAEIDKASP